MTRRVMEAYDTVEVTDLELFTVIIMNQFILTVPPHWQTGDKSHQKSICVNVNVISICKPPLVINPLKTCPEYTRAGVYGKCML